MVLEVDVVLEGIEFNLIISDTRGLRFRKFQSLSPRHRVKELGLET